MVRSFSIVIPVRDNHDQLGHCLASLERQEAGQGFDVTIVDDGSRQPLPFGLGESHGFPAKVVRQVALGVSAARNRGIEETEGEIVVFLDSDVTVEQGFLDGLAAAADEHPEDVAFQAWLRSGDQSLVERMEGLRLEATQRALSDPLGHVRYANTSAFAIRRSALEPTRELFDPGAVRGEDTLVLAWLLGRRTPPRLVDEARAVHRPVGRVTAYLAKHFRIGYFTGPARAKLKRENPGVLLESGGRRGVLREMLAEASGKPAALFAVGLVGLAHVFERCGRMADRMVGLKGGRHQVISMPVDGVREDELVARILGNAARGIGMKITYLTAWTLVQGQRDRTMGRLFEEFDICYSDGMGVVLSSLLVSGRRLHKVTANNFLWSLCEQASRQELTVALIGTDAAGMNQAAERLKAMYPELKVVETSHGYLTPDEEARLRVRLVESQPRLLIVGMGQPLQEQWTSRMAGVLPNSVFLCVGGLFDYIIGVKPTPPQLVRGIGMEWLFILWHCPRRFWRRYLVGLPLLAWFVLREHLVKLNVFGWIRRPRKS